MSPRVRLYRNVGNFNLSSLSLYLRCFNFITSLVALIWTFSKSLISPILYGFQTEFAYSKWDLTVAGNYSSRCPRIVCRQSLWLAGMWHATRATLASSFLLEYLSEYLTNTRVLAAVLAIGVTSQQLRLRYQLKSENETFFYPRICSYDDCFLSSKLFTEMNSWHIRILFLTRVHAIRFTPIKSW